MDLTKIFIDETFSLPPRENYPTKRIIYNHNDEIWSIDCRITRFQVIKTFRCTFFIVDNFSKCICCIASENKNAQTKAYGFSNTLTTSKRKPMEKKR